jgi:hypothetical protein
LWITHHEYREEFIKPWFEGVTPSCILSCMLQLQVGRLVSSRKL